MSLLFTKTNSTYYKLININNKTTCLETLKENYLTKKFNAEKGLCNNSKCVKFIKTKKIPFCCNIDVYSC